MPNHTPGPWRVGDTGVTVFGPQNGKPAPDRIASLECMTTDSWSERRANARLIASAPDLLEALEALLISEESPHSETVRYLARGYARRAIARATGEE